MTLGKAVSLDISSYDAAYVALAEHLQQPLITSDQKLIDKVNNTLVRNIKTFSAT